MANSGHKCGAHFRLERGIEHAILELECRKHVGEVHVTHANKAVFGATKGSQKARYKQFQVIFGAGPNQYEAVCLRELFR